MQIWFTTYTKCTMIHAHAKLFSSISENKDYLNDAKLVYNIHNIYKGEYTPKLFTLIIRNDAKLVYNLPGYITDQNSSLYQREFKHRLTMHRWFVTFIT